MNTIRRYLSLVTLTAVALGSVGCGASAEGEGGAEPGQVSEDVVSYFHNSGTVNGFDHLSVEHNGSMGDSTSSVYKGTTAMKSYQVYDSTYHDRYHSEVVKTNAYQRGDTGFYGFAFRLQADWQFQNQGYVIQQFIADFTQVSGHCDDWMPTSMIWIYGHELHTRVKSGNNCNEIANPSNALNTGSGGWVLPSAIGGSALQVTAGVWHTVEIQALWKSDTTGFYKVWYDGVKVLENYNIATTTTDQQSFEYHVGLYANGWHDDGHMVGTQAARSIWYDQVGIGSSYADANPNGTW
jgi:hypothetical protein